MLYLTGRHHSLVLIWLVFILVVLIGKLAYQQISAQIIVSPQLKLDYSSEEAYGEWTAYAHLGDGLPMGLLARTYGISDGMAARSASGARQSSWSLMSQYSIASHICRACSLTFMTEL